MKMTLYCIVVLLIAVCSAEQHKTAPPQKLQKKVTPQRFFFAEPWNRTFHLRETENGEILTIGAIFATETAVYVYDLAARAIVIFDSSGTVQQTVKLSSIGRNTYAGDDFIVKDSSFIFLNAIDRRLEYFDRTTGKHRRALPLPGDLLSDVKKRSWRTLNRIFLDGDRLMIGNEHCLAAFDPLISKQRATAVTASVPGDQRLLLYRKKGSLILRDSMIRNDSDKEVYHPVTSHFTIAGKRFFTRKNTVFAVDAGRDSVRIVEIK